MLSNIPTLLFSVGNFKKIRELASARDFVRVKFLILRPTPSHRIAHLRLYRFWAFLLLLQPIGEGGRRKPLPRLSTMTSLLLSASIGFP